MLSIMIKNKPVVALLALAAEKGVQYIYASITHTTGKVVTLVQLGT